MIVAPLAAMLVQMAISRTREYAADASGAQLSGRPLWLASALERISSAAERIDNVEAETIPRLRICSSSIRCMGRDSPISFATHPPVEDRIRRLEAMAAANGQTAQRSPWSE